VVVRTDLTPAQIKAARLADNKTAESPWDQELLHLELATLQELGVDLELTGFSEEELTELLRDPEETHEGLTDEDAVPEVPEAPVSRPADLWALGDHKLLVGDATVAADVKRLMDGESAD